MIYIADRQRVRPDAWVRVGDVAAATGVPQNYLSKTLNQLARAGILASSRGPTGGFRLAVPAGELTLARVAGVFGEAHGTRCLLGTGPCGHVPECPVHARWKPVALRMAAFFAATTVADVSTVTLDAVVDADFTLVAGTEGAPDDTLPTPPFRTRRPARQESTQ